VLCLEDRSSGDGAADAGDRFAEVVVVVLLRQVLDDDDTTVSEFAEVDIDATIGFVGDFVRESPKAVFFDTVEPVVDKNVDLGFTKPLDFEPLLNVNDVAFHFITPCMEKYSCYLTRADIVSYLWYFVNGNRGGGARLLRVGI